MGSGNSVKTVRFAVFLAVLIFLSATASAANYQDVCKADNFDRANGLKLIGIAFTLVSAAIAGAYMYGKLRQDEHASAWAKDEAQNLVITVLLFAGLLVFFMGSCWVAFYYAGGSPFQASYSYIDQLIGTNGLSMVRQLVAESQNKQLLATSYLFIGFSPFFGSGVAWDANLRAFSAHYELIIDLYLPVIASLTAQKYLLQTIEIVSSAILLPFAFIMRLIPFTRDFGNLLLALFFGLYILVPTMYAMSGAVFQGVVNTGASTFTGYDFSDNAFSGTGNGADLYKIGSTLPQAIFVPNLILVVLITCTMALSKALRTFAV